jgi:hypothetical protein
VHLDDPVTLPVHSITVLKVFFFLYCDFTFRVPAARA